jgi:hypothetical protein
MQRNVGSRKESTSIVESVISYLRNSSIGASRARRSGLRVFHDGRNSTKDPSPDAGDHTAAVTVSGCHYYSNSDLNGPTGGGNLH